ncbi:kinesin-like protein KIN-14C isoform X7 [Physcomitrium patens]|nr:kinesin-like protein KIN-14I isoform X7 [Physcomitrium patens]XP_024363899.1 kinesin-like protein KIN-14I isoform X7 [Physcomitrium patens]|eukprot:XP_024363898.1 kinesin-like protein KIN-14I isoform X7 [Physcomitrella patens]
MAIEDMGLPVFEASDLEKGPMSSNASAKLVDCILGLKSFHDWKQGGALGFWRLKSPADSIKSCATLSATYSNHSKNANICSKNSRRKWIFTDQDSLDGTSLSSSPDQSINHPTFVKQNGTPLDIMRAGHSGRNYFDGKNEERALNPDASVSTTTWLKDIRHKFSEVLQMKAKQIEETVTAIPIATETFGGATLSCDHNAPSQSLLSLITAIVGDKPAEEVPMLVELMLRKIMEEFEHHLLTQRNQVTKMKCTLKDMMVREEKHVPQSVVSEALAAGTQEENKVEKSTVDEEEINNQKCAAVQDSKHLLDNNKHPNDDGFIHPEKEKEEIMLNYKVKVLTLKSQLTEASKAMQEMDDATSRMKTAIREKDAKWGKILTKIVKEFKELRWAQLGAKEEVLRIQFDCTKHLKHLEEDLQNLIVAASGYQKVLAENRQLYNDVQDLKGNIRVYCRVRPFLTKESTRQTTIDYVGENGELILLNPIKLAGKESRRSFVFNRCFNVNASQEEVFLDTQPLIRSALDGFNVCIFAYGQTGSGKTFTMSGPNNLTPTTWGVNYRALNDLFFITQSRVHVFRYEIGVQMLEIYNEQVRDLLVTDGSHKKLEIRNNSQLNGLNVPDANIMPVRSTDDVLELMKLGQKNRAVGSTSLNDRSSRSHSVLTVHVQGTDLNSGAVFRGSLHLVDLAGSERVDKSEVTGDRLKEAQHINKSLSALGDVISALAQKNGHVPYRNSKLTQLLQDSIGGQAKTLMFVHISPDVESFGETLSTLKFAERVASVELGAARSNKECAEIANLKDQVSQLKDGITKKDAEVARKEFEIANLQMIIERLEKGENNENKSRLKPTISSKLHRRKNNEDQKSRKMTNENGNANVEFVEQTRQPTPKIAGGKKASTSIGLKTGHVPENLAEHFGSPSACSPSDSPSENRIQVEDCQQLKIENERHSAGAKTFDAGTGRFNLCPMQSGLRIGAPSNVQSNEEPTCGGFETILLENIGGRIVAQDDPFLLKNVLDEGFGDDEAFDCRGACEADSASLYSDSCFSTDVDNSGSSHMEQDKKVGSSSFRPLHNRKYMIKNEASTTPDTSTFKVSPPRGGCKSKGGLSRRHKPAGQACTSDTRTSAKRNALPTGNPNQEVEQASSRRSATSAALLTTWR